MSKKHTKKCKGCGTHFKAIRPQTAFCSIDCRNRNEAQRYGKGFLKKRFEVLMRDNFSCQYCGRNPKEDKVKLVVDHMKSKAQKGTDDSNNLITACQDCNFGKGDIFLQKRDLGKRHQRNIL